jgi:hypothetical protein
MKIIKVMVLLASLFAIAGAAFLQLFVLMTNALLDGQTYHRHPSRLGH